jgi:SMC interacting uncharacterized protein involved in chromosome segregation
MGELFDLAPEFWFGTVVAAVISSTIGFLIRKYLKLQEDRINHCDQKIDEVDHKMDAMANRMADLKVELAKVKTTIEILVYGEKTIKDQYRKDLTNCPQ